MLENLVKQLYTLEPQDLPGFEIQNTMSPPYRHKFDLENIKFRNPKLAAVLILLYEDEFGDIHFPIMLRNQYDGVHSNQYSLPGGSFEVEDITYDQTALRETTEELGLFDENIEVICQLTELYIPPSQFLVYPFVGIHRGVPNFEPDETEVQFVVPINLESFLNTNPTEMAHHFKEQPVNVPAYQIGENDYIWGATAMILEEFKSVIK